jgi:hypothetical protein
MDATDKILQIRASASFYNAAALFFYDYVIPFGDSREEV